MEESCGASLASEMRLLNSWFSPRSTASDVASQLFAAEADNWVISSNLATLRG